MQCLSNSWVHVEVKYTFWLPFPASGRSISSDAKINSPPIRSFRNKPGHHSSNDAPKHSHDAYWDHKRTFRHCFPFRHRHGTVVLMEQKAEASFTNFHKLHNTALSDGHVTMGRGGGAAITDWFMTRVCFHVSLYGIEFSQHPCSWEMSVWPGPPVRFV